MQADATPPDATSHQAVSNGLCLQLAYLSASTILSLVQTSL